ncbi:hypothetical protein JHK87_040487 [Glycine soja]|nr:hypothetical protein JHK87_040487 [Glycine soja]
MLVHNALREHTCHFACVLYASFLHCLATLSSSPDVQIVAFDAIVNMIRLFFKPSMFHKLLRTFMVDVLTLLNGFEGSYFKRRCKEDLENKNDELTGEPIDTKDKEEEQLVE